MKQSNAVTHSSGSGSCASQSKMFRFSYASRVIAGTTSQQSSGNGLNAKPES